MCAWSFGSLHLCQMNKNLKMTSERSKPNPLLTNGVKYSECFYGINVGYTKILLFYFEKIGTDWRKPCFSEESSIRGVWQPKSWKSCKYLQDSEIMLTSAKLIRRMKHFLKIFQRLWLEPTSVLNMIGIEHPVWKLGGRIFLP